MVEGLVQAILVGKSGTHPEVVEAVALASTLAYIADPEDKSWKEWLSGRFTKSVRKTDKNLLLLQNSLGGTLVSRGHALALALKPMKYEDMPKVVSGARVSGIIHPQASFGNSGGLYLAINEDLEMTTGKCAAQVAHGVLAWYLQTSEIERQAWISASTPISITSMPQKLFSSTPAILSIHDAGFTEIAPNSETVKVLSFNLGHSL